MLTDYALAAMCVGFAIILWRRSRARGGRRVHLWILAFGATAVAAILGGTAHGFRVPLGESWKVVWSATVWSIAASSVLLIASGVSSALRSEEMNPRSRGAGIRWLERGIAVSLVALTVLVAKLAVHEHFNQNDIYHVIQMGGLYCLYRGAVLLHGLASESGT